LGKFIPKSVGEDDWKTLPPNRPFAILSNQEKGVWLRLGKGKAFYIEIISPQFGGRLLNSVEYDGGDAMLLSKLSDHASLKIGRTADTQIKIAHPYISRHHLELSLDGNVLVAKDLGSVNGSFFHKGNISFDIEAYIDGHRSESKTESTWDDIHVAFGPTLEDFLKRYQSKKDIQK